MSGDARCSLEEQVKGSSLETVTLPVVWTPEANEDLLGARACYDNIRPELGEHFALAVEATVEGGGTVAYDAGGHCRILSGIACGSSGFGGGDTLSMGAASHLRLRTRSAGGQPAINGRVETAQTEE